MYVPNWPAVATRAANASTHLLQLLLDGFSFCLEFCTHVRGELRVLLQQALEV
jgi:hypothetical protein